MPALSFQKQFVAAVESGEKTQTIRARRKRPFKIGDTLYLYYGMRTKQCRKLGEAICTSVKPITLHERSHPSLSRLAISLSDTGFTRALNPLEKSILAEKDGFEDLDAMFDWFGKTHGLPFEGFLIRWDPNTFVEGE